MKAKTVSITDRVLWISNTLFHQTYAVVTIFILWVIIYNNSFDIELSWHMVLCTVAYLPLMGEAIILFDNNNVWSRKIERSTKFWIHGITLFLSAVLLSIGIFIYTAISTGPHFQTIHGWTGFTSWVFIVLSQVLGLASASSQLFSNFLRPVYVKFAHNLLGLVGYVFGIVSLAYGLEKGSFTRRTSTESKHAAFWLLGITTCWSILTALRSAYGQIKTILF